MSRGTGHEPERTCIVCGKKRKQRNLVRMVLRDGRVITDEHRRLPGRGAYACADGQCIGMALGNYKNCLNRAFRTGHIKVF